MARGTCDCCDAQNVRVSRVWVTGIETFACTKCSGGDARRCETNECDGDGSCFACGAINGEICQDQD